jgi:hypothetical protein
MLEHAGLNDLQLAQEFDTAIPEQIKKWQSDPQMTWAWESYQISTQRTVAAHICHKMKLRCAFVTD